MNRIIIIGGGFGGLEAAFSLKGLLKAPVSITLIDRSPYHSFIPSIHLIVSNKISSNSIQIPLRTVLAPAHIEFINDDVLSINPAARQVTTGSGAFSYDYLILSSGAANNFFNIPGAEEYSCRFRTPEDAARIRTALLELMTDSTKPCSISVAGAGTEGVEVAGELLDFIKREGHEHDLQAGRVTIEMIEGKSTVLPSFPFEVQELAADYLQKQGVILTMGDSIAEVRKKSLVLASGQTRDASTLIWSGGIQPSKLIRELPYPKDPSGWLKVTDRLHVSEDSRVYGIGDAVSIYGDHGQLALQRLPYHAQDQARVAALNIYYDIEGKEQVAYVPKIRPQLISMGKDVGIFTFEDKVYSGRWVIDAKKAVERRHMMAYLSRPVSSALWSVVPGASLLQRLRTKLPV